jgi:cysteine desulfurase
MKRIYLDHAAATPVDPVVRACMEPYWSEGVSARRALDAARSRIAAFLGGVHADEIIITSGSTESANLALVGSVRAWKRDHPDKIPQVIISAIEHAAVMETATALVSEGVRVDVLPVDRNGLVVLEKLPSLLTPETVVVSVMYANNEIGTIEPLAAIAKLIRKWKKEERQVTRDKAITGDARYPLFHTDASQATNYCDMTIAHLGVDLLTLNAAKCYGPKGVGLLYVARGTPVAPLLHGGGHERGLRAGTENVPLVIGMAEALSIAGDKRAMECERLIPIRDALRARLCALFPDVLLNGSADHCLPNTVNFSFPDIDHEFLTLALDARGFAVATKSACNEWDAETSHVLLAIREADGSDAPRSGIRVTMGRATAMEDIVAFVDTLAEIRDTMLTVL